MSGFRIFFGGGAAMGNFVFHGGDGCVRGLFSGNSLSCEFNKFEIFQGRGWSGKGGGPDPAPRMLDK